MSASTVHFCDGPACLASNQDAADEDDLVAAGWLVVTFMGVSEDDDEEERHAHLHTAACLVAWAKEEADAQSC